LSDVLKENIDLVAIGGRTLQAEHQMEAFYSFHVTPWLSLTGDLQIIRPVRSVAKTATVPGVRLGIKF
jgi:carbohydrate-selective porin OprB